MRRSSILGFEKLIQLSQAGCHEISLCQLLGLVAGPRNAVAAEPYSVDALRERFRGTWWEVIWSSSRPHGIIDKDVQCKYVADSFQDALRRYPHAAFLHVETAEMLSDDYLDDDSEATMADRSVSSSLVDAS